LIDESSCGSKGNIDSAGRDHVDVGWGDTDIDGLEMALSFTEPLIFADCFRYRVWPGNIPIWVLIVGGNKYQKDIQSGIRERQSLHIRLSKWAKLHNNNYHDDDGVCFTAFADTQKLSGPIICVDRFRPDPIEPPLLS